MSSPAARLRRVGLPSEAVDAFDAWWPTLSDVEQRSWAAAIGVTVDGDLVADWVAFPDDVANGGAGEVVAWAEAHRTPGPAALAALAVEQSRAKPRPTVTSRLEKIAAGEPAD